MEGVRFVVDDKGEKTAVLIDLKEYADIWEDFYESLLAHERLKEPRESLDFVKKRLQQQGKLDE